MAPIRHTLRIALGIGLVLLGIVGLILPIMPGWIFLIPGLLILADYFPPIHRLVEFMRRKFRDAEEGFRKSRQSETDTSSMPERHPITPSAEDEQREAPSPDESS